MYAAVGSYIVQAWRLFDLRIRHHPPYCMAATIAILIYANFFETYTDAALRHPGFSMQIQLLSHAFQQ
jgi:uncharacterized membrane protein YoaT (DUF817 family)